MGSIVCILYLFPMALRALIQLPRDGYWAYEVVQLFALLPAKQLECDEKRPRSNQISCCDFWSVISWNTENEADVV
jgi:hypothetical protein